MDLPNYNVFNCNRLSRMGGGVAVYMSVNLPAKVLLTSSSDGYSPEYIFFEIKCKGADILFVCMYRPPQGWTQWTHGSLCHRVVQSFT